MSTRHENGRHAQQTADPCWKTIGVSGDGSCSELERAVHCRNCQVFREAGQQLFEREPPDDYVAEQTAVLAERSDEEATSVQAMIVFRVAEEWLALNVAAVIEVAQPRPIHRVPHRSDRLLVGIANVRGELQLCASLRALLNIDDSDGTDGVAAAAGQTDRTSDRLLVCQCRERRWAFPVDDVAGVQHVPKDQLGNVPSTIARSVNRLVRAVFDWEQKSVGQLDEDRLFDTLEERIG